MCYSVISGVYLHIHLWWYWSLCADCCELLLELDRESVSCQNLKFLCADLQVLF